MIDIDALLKILPLFTLGLISPGPDFMIVSATSLSKGRMEGIKTAAGITTVTSFYTLICLLGLTTVFGHYLWLMIAVKILGGIYLIYLAIMMWRSSLLPSVHPTTQPSVKTSRRSSYLVGVFTCLTNPKVIAFFASIFALAITHDTTPETKAAIVLTTASVCFSWFSFVAFGLSKPSVRERYQRWRRIIDRVTGSVLALFGIKLLFSARN